MKLLDIEKVHESWLPFFTEDKINEIAEIERKLDSSISPSIDQVLKFSTMDLDNIKVCIIGQDPYPSKLEVVTATDRTYEIGSLKSWTCSFPHHSLKNIVRLIYKAYHDNLVPYLQIREKISSKEFEILEPKIWFNDLEDQGVLFLSKYITCNPDPKNPYGNTFRAFSMDLLAFISNLNPNLHWFLWGEESKKNEEFISGGIVHKSNSPKLYDTDKEDSFLNSRCFQDTKHLIEWRGESEMQKLRKSLPEKTDLAIVELQEIIKKLPPKECYFKNVDDFVAPFTVTCKEEMLMQLLLMEKEHLNEEPGDFISIDEFKKNLLRNIESTEPRDRKYLEQAEKGFIRKYINI